MNAEGDATPTADQSDTAASEILVRLHSIRNRLASATAG